MSEPAPGHPYNPKHCKLMLKNSFRKALVTGGAGFIGSHIIEELLKEEIEVISIDNYLAGKAENLEPLHKLGKLNVVDCDITDMNSLAPHFEGSL